MDYEKLTDEELNTAVAEKVMGFQRFMLYGTDLVWHHPLPEGQKLTNGDLFVFDPSLNIAAAMAVVEKLKADSHQIDVEWHADRGINDVYTDSNGKAWTDLARRANPTPSAFWLCRFWRVAADNKLCWDSRVEAKNASLSRAISLAALRSIEKESEGH